MITGIILPFFAIGFAELGDKTQFAILSLALKTNKHGQLFFGTMLAFMLADGAAILFGSYLPHIFSLKIVALGAGLIFIAAGIITLVGSKHSDRDYVIRNPFISGFGMVLVLEMGDKSQIASALFATQFNPVLVFAGVIASLSCLSLIAIFVGKKLIAKVNPRITSLISGVIFIAVGIVTLMKNWAIQ